ncbi:MAG TPA: ATP-dependent DNA helicase RecG [Thermoanaerobaculia bacterium]|nr:ATP-dependent DNA helicase RecG [Thermoanaerobaculia bacterium]
MLEVAGVGPARAAQLERAGVVTLRDLLWHLPVRYEDRRRIESIGSLTTADVAVVSVVGELRDVRSQRIPRRRGMLSRATVEDGTGSLRAIWFNRPYLPRQVVPGTTYLLSGTLRAVAGSPELVNPSLERWAGAPPIGLTPVYSRLGPLGPAAVRRLILAGLDQADLDDVDPLPQELLLRHGLPELPAALREIHQPSAASDPSELNERQTPGHRRLAYGELFGLQLRLALRRERSRRRTKTLRHAVDDRVRSLARETLPFSLTGAQRRCLRAVVGDMVAPRPMARLLQGEVGSGKTIVATVAMVVALANGHQVAFMAPTELLAEQHRRSLEGLLGGRFPIGLLTRSSPQRVAVARRAAAGEAMLVVGTHSLIEAGVDFPRLGLVVIDEQHRFGVMQRQQLASKGRRADLLVMTATPIPRSLALVLYGDLDLSVLDELPPGRQPIQTRLVPAAERETVLAVIRAHRAAGGQTYVVLPRIATGDGSVPAVEDTGRWYLDQLSDCRGACLTGRTPAPERDRILCDLAAGMLDLVIATTVVEVGIDVPGATLMVIEGAEHFGLSQLHQLRGRVGRGSRPAQCLAVVGAPTPEADRRLATFAQCSDGFAIAEADLALRGPGDLLGVRQAGLEPLRLADPLRHVALLDAASRDARELAASLDVRSLAELASEAVRGHGHLRPRRTTEAGRSCEDASR